ncbi:MAG: hypothetical protein ABSA43_00880 [Candidatus Microgenomates bacterium]|jgi:hypothetical protein
MKVAILTANLGNFDTQVDPVTQDLPNGVEKIAFHRYTDNNFPPITGLTPRLQYRIPKLFGWQMFPGYNAYLWIDSSMSLTRPDSIKWFLGKLGNADIVLFKHPWRKTIKEEVDLIEEKLQHRRKYITARYKNGLHKEQLAECLSDPGFKDTILYTSTAFLYRNNKRVQKAMKLWWYYQSRYFTCDQVVLPYVVFKSGLKVKVISEDQYHIPYLITVSKHK